MADRPLPCRVYLGEYKKRHSLVVHSAKGIEWINVHPRLENVLKRIDTRDILDLALGCEGQYFLKYREGSAVRQVIAPEVLNTTYGQALRSSEKILKVAFGRPGELWAIYKKNESATQILQVRSQVSKFLDLQKREQTTVKDIAYVALGHSRENFAIKIAGEVIIGGQEEMSPEERRKYDKLVAVTLSPLDDTIYFLTFEDGSNGSNLPTVLEQIVQPHLHPERPTLFLEPGTNSNPVFRIANMVGLRVSRSSDTTELELLDPSEPDYKRIQTMFQAGWKHPKSKPDLQYIYGLKLPDQQLQVPLRNWIESFDILRPTTVNDDFERELFHGTARRCNLGNTPELTRPCEDDSCRLCRIVKTSFTVMKAGTAEGRTFLRFGRGIYTSSVSSK